LDHDDVAIKESNYITNILPQHNKLNRMAWLVTEEITECLRDDFDMEVIGGIIMGDNVENDIFVKSHSVRTLDFFWKILINLNNGDV
jgi:endonuclease G